MFSIRHQAAEPLETRRSSPRVRKRFCLRRIPESVAYLLEEVGEGVHSMAALVGVDRS